MAIFRFLMGHPTFAFIVVFVTMLVSKRQLGIKIVFKCWWMQYPNFKFGWSWKSAKVDKKDKEKSLIKSWMLGKGCF